jgi:hypothetical protein
MPVYGLGKATIIATLLGAMSVGAALAEDPGVAGQAQGGTSGNAEIGVTKPAVLTEQQQLDESQAISRKATQLGERLSKLLAEARREKDILRANCVNRKLTEVNANTRNVEQRSKALKDSVAAGDEGRRNHEYTVLSVLSAKLDSLNQEASQCLGQSVYEPGASQVVTTVPNNVLVGVDPSTVPTTPPPPPAVNVPPDISGVN